MSAIFVPALTVFVEIAVVAAPAAVVVLVAAALDFAALVVVPVAAVLVVLVVALDFVPDPDSLAVGLADPVVVSCSCTWL